MQRLQHSNLYLNYGTQIPFFFFFGKRKEFIKNLSHFKIKDTFLISGKYNEKQLFPSKSLSITRRNLNQRSYSIF